MLAMGMSGTTLDIAKTRIPTGGVTWPSSISSTVMTPNQMGSMPTLSTDGKMAGIVSMTMGMAFMTQPRTRYMIMTLIRMPIFPICASAMNVESAVGNLDAARQ